MKHWDVMRLRRNKDVNLVKFLPNGTEPSNRETIYSIDINALLPVGPIHYYIRAAVGGESANLFPYPNVVNVKHSMQHMVYNL